MNFAGHVREVLVLRTITSMETDVEWHRWMKMSDLETGLIHFLSHGLKKVKESKPSAANVIALLNTDEIAKSSVNLFG